MRKKPRVDTYARTLEMGPLAASETNDCTVISLMHLLGLTYEAAHLAMHKAGREPGRGASMHMAVKQLDPELLTEIKLPDDGITLAEFMREHRLGRYWVNVTGHALTVDMGRLFDHSDKPRRRVHYARRVNLKKLKELKENGEETSK